MSNAISLSAAPAFYRHSGKVPPQAAGLGLITAIATGVVGGAVYGALGFLCQLIPAAKLSLLLEICLIAGFSLTLGALPTLVLKRFNARSVPAAVGAAGLASLVGLYVAWVAWFYSYFLYFNDPAPILELVRPQILIRCVEGLNAQGFWAIVGNDVPKGWFLGVIWLIEAGILLIAPMMVAKRKMSTAVFCEGCNRWGKRRDLMQIGDQQFSQLGNALKSGDLSVFNNAMRRSVSESHWCEVYLEGCTECGDLQALSVNRIVLTYDKNKKATPKATPLVKRLLLSPEQTIQLATVAATITAPEALAAAAETPTSTTVETPAEITADGPDTSAAPTEVVPKQ
jgi:hypothetical protein